MHLTRRWRRGVLRQNSAATTLERKTVPYDPFSDYKGWVVAVMSEQAHVQTLVMGLLRDWMLGEIGTPPPKTTQIEIPVHHPNDPEDSDATTWSVASTLQLGNDFASVFAPTQDELDERENVDD